MSMLSLAKKEYLENVRNAWVITVTLVFLTLVLLTAWLLEGFMGDTPADAQGVAPEFNRVVLTLSAMQGFGGFLPPILALLLGFGTLAGERESGSLSLLVAQPLSRTEILLGKWLGLYGVLATAVLVGYGVGGMIVLSSSNAGSVGWQALGMFILITLGWTAAWISVTILLSAFFQRRGTAIAGSIGLWFVFGSFVWGLLTLALAGGPDRFMTATPEDPPAWLLLMQVLNPNQVYDALLMAGIEGFGMGFDIVALMRNSMQDLGTVSLFTFAMLAWILVPVGIAAWLFTRRDI